ncbi:DNA repair protein RadC [Candidatus Daviesbacteria bacterium]|nr:DNA repair protein RadC [Candidatus Daviesbacteria bacterium]
MKIKDLPKIDRPREKLIRYGPEKLSNSELLAILLGTGIKGINVVELSNKILKKFTGNNLTRADVKALKNTTGLGETKACEIVACFELGKRLLKEKKTELILSPKDVWEQLKDIRDLKKEHFMVFYLDTRNQEICREIISIGTLNESLVHPREVFEPAIRNSAAQIIIAHNHPSGNPDPSEEDIKITAKLADAGKLLGIELFDHIIVTGEGFFSMSKENLV